MNDPLLVAEKLDELIKAIPNATGEAEKAALFSAVRILAADLDRDYGQAHPYLGEQITKLTWSVGAALGYDTTNGHDQQAHVSWAFAALHLLKGLLRGLE